MLLIIYARVGITPLYSMLVLFAECWESKFLIQARVEKLNGDLYQPSEIRYVSRSFSVRCYVSLAYGKWLISEVTLSIVVPQAIWSFLHKRIGNHTGEFLVIFFGDFIGIQCSWIALISLFLSRVWGHVCLVVSDRSKVCLNLFVLPSFYLFSSYMQVFASQPRVHAVFTGISTYICGFSAHSRVCPEFWFLEEY